MKKLLYAACSVFFLLGMVGLSQATVLTFDDISSANSGVIGDGYGGLGWDDMGYIKGSYRPGSGYENGTVSGDYVAFNRFARVATVSDSIFDFQGAYLTAAWNNDLNIEVKGFKDDNEVYSQTVTVDIDSPTWFDFDFLGIDSLQFRSYGGVHAEQLAGHGEHFAMDDFTFSTPVPEPSTVILLGLGLVGIAGVRRQRREA